MPVSAAGRYNPDGDRWFVVQTQPRREELGARNPARQGCRVFLPQFTKTVRHARRSRTVRRPLFPGYAFSSRWIWRSIAGVRFSAPAG
jgi:transcriptional antiterminator RfaH